MASTLNTPGVHWHLFLPFLIYQMKWKKKLAVCQTVMLAITPTLPSIEERHRPEVKLTSGDIYCSSRVNGIRHHMGYQSIQDIWVTFYIFTCPPFSETSLTLDVCDYITCYLEARSCASWNMTSHYMCTFYCACIWKYHTHGYVYASGLQYMVIIFHWYSTIKSLWGPKARRSVQLLHMHVEISKHKSRCRLCAKTSKHGIFLKTVWPQWCHKRYRLTAG